MTAPRIQRFRWDGAAMVPLYPGAAARQYETGGIYTLEERQQRSAATHNHFFACLQDGFANLPENLAERFPTVEALRKWLLIKCGYRDERQIVLASKAEAVRVAAFVRPLDPLAVVIPREATVTIYTARSQSLKAMNRKEFAESKSKVLDALAELIGVERKALEENAKRVA